MLQLRLHKLFRSNIISFVKPAIFVYTIDFIEFLIVIHLYLSTSIEHESVYCFITHGWYSQSLNGIDILGVVWTKIGENCVTNNFIKFHLNLWTKESSEGIKSKIQLVRTMFTIMYIFDATCVNFAHNYLSTCFVQHSIESDFYAMMIYRATRALILFWK